MVPGISTGPVPETSGVEWRFFTLRCLRGASSTLYFIRVHARDVGHAIEIAKQSGYEPMSVD